MDQESTVVIGLLGTTLDMGKHPDRWQNWRPSVALCRQPDLIVKRFELLHGSREKSLADLVVGMSRRSRRKPRCVFTRTTSATHGTSNTSMSRSSTSPERIRSTRIRKTT